MTHYVKPEDYTFKEWNVVYTSCGKYWIEAYAITTDKNKVTCKKCQLKLQKHGQN